VIQKDKSIELQVQHNADLYSTEMMQFYLEGFCTFLECLTAEPETALSTHHLMSIRQRQQVIVDWNDTTLEYPEQSTLNGEFSRQAAETPEAIAIKFGDQKLTYAEVDARSTRIARYLQSQGVTAGDLVGICVDRSAEMLAYLYAIMKSGAGYVPLDPAYPSERLQYMCDHSGLKLIVTEQNLSERIAAFNKPLLIVDSAVQEIDQLDSSPLEETAQPSDICYVIYTSGSTGKPKGVQVPHGAVVNFLYAMRQTPGFTADDSVLAVTTLSFDIAVLELYLPTISGGTVVILDSLTAADGVKLGEQLNQHEISVMQATPATWRLMIQAGWSGKQGLKILCGGEPMPKDLVQPLLERCSELWNMYGPTETTVWSAAFQVTSAEAPILIGKPIGNTQIYILDKNGNEVPVGCEGEVFIGGAGVTLGYRNRQDLTDERFVENRYRNPFVNYVSDRLYKTGDLARYQSDGNIQFLRRNDKQVKVRGFRIELGEIESALDAFPQIEQNVVIVREDTIGDARLVAYFVARPRERVETSQLRDQLRQKLPHYMVPQHVVQLDAFPQTNNGKIDYKALPAPAAETSDSGTIVSPQTPAEKYLAEIWAEVLETDEIDLNDTFFDIGGHSLLVMQVITKVFEKTGIKLGPQDFLVGTLEQLAVQIAESDTFKEPAGTLPDAQNLNAGAENLVTAELNAEPDPEPQVQVDEKPGGAFRILKGFWD
jgi:amino acid adenylation domain-containing protein